MKLDTIKTIKPTTVEHVEMLCTEIDDLRGDTTVTTFAPELIEKAVRQLVDLLQGVNGRVIVGGEILVTLYTEGK